MSYFVTCTHEQRILNGTSSDTSLCHWGTWKKKFSQTSQISQIWPDLARSGQIWPDLGRLGKFFFQKKKFFFPDLARSGRPRSGDLARSGSIRVYGPGINIFLWTNFSGPYFFQNTVFCQRFTRSVQKCTYFGLGQHHLTGGKKKEREILEIS